MLEPLQDLEKLCIRYYWGTTMPPIWLASLSNLKELYLNHATELISLPPLRMISCLESLTIKFAERLKKVGVEFLGIESENKKEDIKIFPNLKYLEFFGLDEWEESTFWEFGNIFMSSFLFSDSIPKNSTPTFFNLSANLIVND